MSAMSYGHEAPGWRPRRFLTDAQVVAVAAFESDFGHASHVPPGPRRERFLSEAYVAEDEAPDLVVVQDDRSYARPKVLVVWPDGTSVRADMEAWQ